MIRQDAISKLFSAVAISELIFGSTFSGSLQVPFLIAEGILISGLVMEHYFGFEKEDANLDSEQRSSIALYSAISIAVFFVLNEYVPNLPLAVVPNLSAANIVPAKMFQILIAVAEEQFFRGFLANLLVARMGVSMGILADGLVFSAYHFAVYGSSVSSLVIVFGAGATLAYVAWKTQRVSVSMIGHIVNNLIAGGV